MKLLVVEDEGPMAGFLRRGLTEEGFAVDVADNADSADSNVGVYEYDAILLDVMLPGVDGFELCRKWRTEGLSTPILFLTARDGVDDRVKGLEIGGDDYLVKPFSFDELLARVRALIRRRFAGPGRRMDPELRIGAVVIDTNRRAVRKDGQLVPLTTREYQLLEYLARNPGRLVTRTALWEHVWESGSEPDSNVIDVYIRYLRTKLGRDFIETVRGAGYILQAETADKETRRQGDKETEPTLHLAQSAIRNPQSEIEGSAIRNPQSEIEGSAFRNPQSAINGGY